ncbi:hypothetical protein D3C78_1330150 [compost metagenome]
MRRPFCRNVQILKGSLDTDVVGYVFVTNITLQQVKIIGGQPEFVIKLMHSGIEHDPLQILAAPGDKHDAFASTEPGDKIANNLRKTTGLINILLRNSCFFLNKAVELGKISWLD